VCHTRVTQARRYGAHLCGGRTGLLLVQWAKHLGARVFGTVSSEEKAQAAREASPGEVILYTTQDFVTECTAV
jgi:NADPH:quinone reductase